MLLDACLRDIDARKSAPGDNREKVIPSKDEPAVIVFCDEMAVVLGQNMGGNQVGEGPTNRQLAVKSKRMTIIGWSEAIDPLFAVQRGTVTMTGDGDLKSQCDLRIGLGVATEADARLIVPDDQVAIHDLARLTEPGSALVWRKNGRCAPVKVYRCEPEDVAEVCRRAHVLRPAPDARLREAFGQAYEERWSHRGQYLLPSGASPPGPSWRRLVRTLTSSARSWKPTCRT